MLSREYLINRGTCCGLGCLMCPYEPKHTEGVTEVMKKIINCFKEDNPLIQKKLRRCPLKKDTKLQQNYFRYLTKEGTVLGWQRIKWELMHKWPWSMFVNLWYLSIQKLFQKK